MASKTEKSSLRFRRLGGALQPAITSFADFPELIALDDAHWAVTSLAIGALRIEDTRFLKFLDADNDAVIRVDEVKLALRFLVNCFKTGRGVNTAASELELDDIKESDNTAALRAGIAQILLNLGKPQAKSISLADLAAVGGTGVEIDDEKCSPEIVSAITEFVKATVGCSDGTPEVPIASVADLVNFMAVADKFFDWKKRANQEAELRPFGDDTMAFYTAFRNVCDEIDNYFLNCEAVNFLNTDPERMAKRNIDADMMSSEDVKSALNKLVIAYPGDIVELNLSGAINPLRKAAIAALTCHSGFAEFLSDGKLSRKRWEDLKALFQPVADYLAAEPLAGKISAIVDAMSPMLENGCVEKLRVQREKEADAAARLAGYSEVLKLLVLQRYMLEFVNNFASLDAIFDVKVTSMLQMGELIIDGRHYSLTVPVTNLAEHKRIVALSSICCMYVELYGKNSPKTLVAVAVTSGSMRSLFIGKEGVFITPSKDVLGAKVVDLFEQPVAIGEAFKEPFFVFAKFFQTHVAGFFSSKTVDAQKNISNSLNSQLAGNKTAPTVSPVMMLMGGGIGIAALGSSAAFIAKTLRNVSLWSVLLVIIGILLIFGGPVIVSSLVKLYFRNLSRFLEASGSAINHNMRLTFRLGSTFTYTPKIGNGKFKFAPALLMIRDVHQEGGWKKPFLIIAIIVLLLGACGFVGYKVYQQGGFWGNKTASTQQEALSQPANTNPTTQKVDAPVMKK